MTRLALAVLAALYAGHLITALPALIAAAEMRGWE